MEEQARQTPTRADPHMTRTLRLSFTLSAALLAAAPGAAHAAKPKYPSVTKVAPMKVGVGDTLTISGRNFRSGKGRNTVVFKRLGGRAVFVKAGKATSRKITVKLPAKMLTALSQKEGNPVSTRFRVRVAAVRLGLRFTAMKRSPLVEPESRAGRDPGDGDGDRLGDALELKLGLNPSREDTDEDGVGDGFEYYSAKDLNGKALPFPGKQPYPNGLDKEDGGIDHDGDGLSLRLEYKAWKFTGSPLPLSYSDGNQFTGGGPLLDSDKDVDDDGASNYSEASGPLSGPEWWKGYTESTRCTDKYVESPYPGPRYEGLSFVDPDSDGDGVPDGADDIDHDGLTNAVEGKVRRPDWCSVYVSVGPLPLADGASSIHPGGDKPDAEARIDPFNPCKPVNSAACHRFVPNGYYLRTKDYTEDWLGPEPPQPP